MSFMGEVMGTGKAQPLVSPTPPPLPPLNPRYWLLTYGVGEVRQPVPGLPFPLQCGEVADDRAGLDLVIRRGGLALAL